MEIDKSKEKTIGELIDTPKFTDWKNEPTARQLKQDYEDAASDRQNHISKVDEWLDALYITGKVKRTKVKGRSTVVPKLIRKQAEWRYASLSEPFLDTDDIFNVSPITYEDKEGAEQNQLVLNHQFNTQINKNQFIDEYVRTAVDEGTVIVRVGWNEEEKLVEEPEFALVLPSAQDEVKITNSLQQILNSVQEDPNYVSYLRPEEKQAFEYFMQTGEARAIKQIGFKKVPKVVANHPTLDIVNYNNITIDPTAEGNIDNAKFVIYSFETSLSELQKNPKYRNLEQINIENNTILGEEDHEVQDESNFNFQDKPRKKFVAYEYWGFWDIEGNGVLEPIVATYVGDILIHLDRNPFPDQKLPFVVVQYLPVRKSMYGEPDGSLLKDNQDIMGAVVRGMIDTMGRSANGQQGIRKDALDVTNWRKFLNGQDYQFNPGIDPRAAVYMHQFPEIPTSAQFMLQMQSAEAESLTGVRPFSQSTTGNLGSTTAAGVRSARDAATKRETGILRRLATGMKQIGRKIISMNAEFLEEETIVRVTNDKFVPVRRDDLAGNYDLKLSISTAEADAAKAEELAFMLQTTGQTMGPEFSQIILADIAKLRKMPDLARKIEEYQPQPDPLAQEKAALEIELLKAQIANEQAKANENNANAALDNAKADNLNSDTDKKNLDYLEQESGVTQERELQKQGAQARANIELENVKAYNKLAENLSRTNNSNT